MLKLEHIHKSFSSKIIFDDTEFIANPNELTILIGPSGAGKTTLFNIILNIENCEYCFNNEDISSLDKKGKEQFILDNISYASQKPTFIADLKMKDQIDLLKQIYSNDYDVSELISLFELEKLLDCYPNQLSGGEKSRFAFILALLKPAQIYMFDEPTSALDDIQASHIVAVLNDLKNKGNIVIISTHDHRLIEQGDKVYRIEDKKLNNIRQSENDKPTNKDKPTKEFKIKELFSYWLKMKEHHKFYNTCMKLLMALGIVFSICGLEYGVLCVNRMNLKIENEESNTIIVFKKQRESDYFLSSTESLPFTQEEIHKLSTMNHVKNYDFFMDYQIPSMQRLCTSEDEPWMNRYMKIQLNGIEKEIEFDAINGDGGYISTYPNEMYFDDKILEKWNDEGLYVSKYFYETYLKDIVKTEEDKKNIVLDYPLFVPQYLEKGGSSMGDTQVMLDAGTYMNVKFKVKGIMKERSLIDCNPTSYNSFSLSNEELRGYMEKYKREDYQSCVYRNEEKKFICNNKGEKYELISPKDYTFEYIPWTPTAMVVEVDSIQYINLVNEELEKMGFGTYSRYIQTDNLISANNTMRNNTIITSIIVFLLIVFMNIILKINNKDDEYSFTLYFKEKGFTKKMINRLNNQKYLMNAIDLACTVVVLMIIVNVALYLILGFHLFGAVENYIIIALMIFIIEYIIPKTLEKYYSKVVE